MAVKIRFALAVLIVLAVVVAPGAQSTSVLLQKGIYAEETLGDLDAAVKIYEDIVAEAEAKRSQVAQAQYRLAMCYLKQGRQAQAAAAFQKVIDQFPTHPAQVTQARTRLAALTEPARVADPAARAIRRVWVVPADLDIEGDVSADGRYVPLDDELGNLVVRDLVSGEILRLTHNQLPDEYGHHGDASISPDNQWVAYSWRNPDRSRDLRVVGLDGSGQRVLYHHADVDDIDPFDWTPDGTQILARFERQDDTWQIVMVSVADGSVRVLKSVGWWDYPRMSLSPDGRYIAYDVEPDERSEDDIFLLAADGSSEIPLVEGPFDDEVVGWSPDGTSILFLRDESPDDEDSEHLWSIQVSDGKPQGSPELVRRNVGTRGRGITKDGALFYDVRGVLPNQVQMTTLNLVTGELLSFQARATDPSAPDWSPDGTRLAYYVAPQVIAILSMETGEERELYLSSKVRLDNRPAIIRWSPDGRSFLLRGRDREERHELYHLVDTQTGEVTSLVPPGRGQTVEDAIWSPDGQDVFYLRRASTRGPNAVIVVRNLQTGDERELYGPASMGGLAISPDGRLLAFGSLWVPGTGTPAINVIATEGGEPQELLRVSQLEDMVPSGMNIRPTSLAWTPDGRYVIFKKARYGQLWRIAREGGEPEELGEMNGFGVAVHPDGSRIAFASLVAPRTDELWVMENFRLS